MKKLILSTIFVTLAAALLIFPTVKSSAAAESKSFDFTASDNVNGREILNLINLQRRKRGLTDLRWDDNLERLARRYSEQMADERFFSHYDQDGYSVVQRAQAMKIKGWRKIGENLFMCSSGSKINSFAVEKWMSSPLHRKNILDQSFNTTGIGFARSRDGMIYITQVFTQN